MAALQAWLQTANPAPPVSLSARPIANRGGGYGMVANQPIKKGEKLVNVPRTLWMTSQTARSSPLCSTLISENDLDVWKRREDSFWRSYIELLPDQSQHPLLWTPDQQGWLKGSPMTKKLGARLDQVAGDLDFLLAAGANLLDVPSADETDLVSESSLKWAAATLLSRSFNLEIPVAGTAARPVSSNGTGGQHSESEESVESVDDDGDEVVAERILALVPWADTINHCSTATERSILQYDQENDAAVLFAHRDYTEGEEVYDSYGTWLTPSELLLDYGFVDPANRNYAIQVPATSIVTPAGDVNAQLVEAVHIGFNGCPELTLTETGIDDTLLSYMRCSLSPKERILEAGWSPDWTAEVGPADLPLDTMARLVDPIDFNTEAKVLETLASWCDRQLAGYGATLQSDLAELEDGSTPWLRVQALRALVAEKQTIVGLQKELRGKMQQLQEGCPLETLYE